MKRQGDLLIIEVAQKPAKALPTNTRVLAEGEKTGHKHELTGGLVYDRDGTLYFEVPQNCEVTLKHPEHNPLTFIPGTYKVIRQREYLPGDWRYVQD